MTQNPAVRTVEPMKLPPSFHREMAALVRELEGMGWFGRMSKPGHAIMRAPDGETTCSITPKLGSPRHLANNRAKIDRWKRAQAEQVVAVTDELPAGEPVNQSLAYCPDCGKPFVSEGRVRIHQAHQHSERVACPECGRLTSAAQAAKHQASHHREPRSIGQLYRDMAILREQLAEARDEAQTWEAVATEATEELATARAVIRAANLSI